MRYGDLPPPPLSPQAPGAPAPARPRPNRTREPSQGGTGSGRLCPCPGHRAGDSHLRYQRNGGWMEGETHRQMERQVAVPEEQRREKGGERRERLSSGGGGVGTCSSPSSSPSVPESPHPDLACRGDKVWSRRAPSAQVRGCVSGEPRQPCGSLGTHTATCCDAHGDPRPRGGAWAQTPERWWRVGAWWQETRRTQIYGPMAPPGGHFPNRLYLTLRVPRWDPIPTPHSQGGLCGLGVGSEPVKTTKQG